MAASQPFNSSPPILLNFAPTAPSRFDFYDRSQLEMRNIAEFRRYQQMATEKKTPSKRELIEPNKGDKRYVRRKADGTFGKTVDVGKSLAVDRCI